MKERILKKASVLVFLLFFGLGSSPSYGQYALHELGTLGGLNTYAYDINDSGQIVGAGETGLRDEGGPVVQAFFGTKDRIDPLFPNETGRSSANAINRSGAVAGYKNGSAFIGGSSPFVDFGLIPGATPGVGLGLNNGGIVVGYSTGMQTPETGSLWENSNGSYVKRTLGSFGGFYTRATSLNDASQIVGHSQNLDGYDRAFRWNSAGTEPMVDLGVLEGYNSSFALRINNKGTIIGYSWKTDAFYNETYTACLWGLGGVRELKRKDDSSTPGTILESKAYGVNDADVVVGTYLTSGGYRAFIWDGTNEMRDLNSLLPENSGITLMAAFSINNKGEIVGYGRKTGSPNDIAFLLVPPVPPAPPEPPPEPDPEPFEVDIDFRPWSSNNKVNLHAWWSLIPIAILSDADFDAPAEADRQSLTFGRSGDEESLAFCMPWKLDVNRDGKKDFVCFFHERAMGFRCGDTLGTLKGQTHSGEKFGGQAKIQVVGCPPPRKHHRGR
jgi:probable HAF family extracellular repeat protein